MLCSSKCHITFSNIQKSKGEESYNYYFLLLGFHDKNVDYKIARKILSALIKLCLIIK